MENRRDSLEGICAHVGKRGQHWACREHCPLHGFLKTPDDSMPPGMLKSQVCIRKGPGSPRAASGGHCWDVGEGEEAWRERHLTAISVLPTLTFQVKLGIEWLCCPEILQKFNISKSLLQDNHALIQV